MNICAILSFSFPALWSIKSCDVPKTNTEEVFHKIADAAMKLYRLGSSAPVNAHVTRALREYLATLIAQGIRDNQTLLDEGVAFLRRHEIKKVI
jgi:hypothetical protein